MPSKNLLLCFDAFGTLFKPRHPISQQYGEVARSLGLSTIKNEDIEKSFKAAFKQESKQNPNYGKHTNLNPEKWWSKVISHTFTPLLPPNEKLPTELVPRLLHRFGSQEGYELFHDVIPLFHQIQQAQKVEKDLRIIVGVITNSDDRVPEILTSLGVRVGPLRFPEKGNFEDRGEYDVHFSVMSYDVGYEKPHGAIFEAATDILVSSLIGVLQEGDGSLRDWTRVHVGDDFGKDVEGAIRQSWSGVLVQRGTFKEDMSDVEWIGDYEIQDSSYEDVFRPGKALGVRSLEELAKWLPGGSEK